MGYILTGSSDVRCPHGGMMYCETRHAQTIYIDNYPVWVLDDNYRIEGCPIGKFCCREVKWDFASRTRYINHIAILTSESIGSCFDYGSGQNGRAIILSHQTKVTDD